MHQRLRRLAVAVLTTTVVAASATIATSSTAAVAAPPDDISTQAVYDPTATFAANWTREQALGIRANAQNTTPRIPANFPTMTEEVWIWDTWPLTDLDMNPVAYNGYNIIFSLVAPRNIFFGDRHWQAKIGYFYSKDAKSWKYGGELFPAGSSFGSREWAGSTVLESGSKVHTFYTASGRDNGGINPNDPLQRLAHAAGNIYTTDEGVFFRGFDDHTIIAEADGTLYQTLQQSQAGPIIYAFRDPFVFRDPTDHKIYALFEGNNGGVAGSHRCDPQEIGDVPADHVVPDQARFYTGNIGLMEAQNSALDQWKLLPPLLSAECTNQQTERPHLVVKNGLYHLWTISHQFTFAPGLTGPDGLYGFVGQGLRSDYVPLNGTALVLGNPAEAPLQNYSHFVMPNLLVESFIDTVPTGNGDEVRYGGTLAPTLQLSIEGTTTRLTNTLPYGYIPALRAAGGGQTPS
ncbi:MAG TPA: glycoside hydrolase family 68 protein [Actinoplanes sp.]